MTEVANNDCANQKRRTKFDKECLFPGELIPLLKKRGLVIEDDECVINYLSHIGYFRLSAYFRPFYINPKSSIHKFKKGTTLEQILSLYRFDRKLRQLVFNEIEKIEVAFRSALSNIGSRHYNDLFWMTKCESYNRNSTSVSRRPRINGESESEKDRDRTRRVDKTLSTIQDAWDTSKEEFVKHFKETYPDPYPPAWMIAEILPLGSLCAIYRNLNCNATQKDVAKQFELPVSVFSSWLEVLTNLRNMCCHHARMWNKNINIDPAYPLKQCDKFISNKGLDLNRMYIRLAIVKYLLNYTSPYNQFTTKLQELLKHYNITDLGAMGFPENWEDEPVWIEKKIPRSDMQDKS